MSFQYNKAVEDHDLRLPRILCLHGGGSNSKIFQAQCRRLIAKLRVHFRLVFVDGPFLSEAGPCVQSVYKDWGPFHRWLPWAPGDPVIDGATAFNAIEGSLQRAMDEDDRKGAAGEWVALLGFSQGAKVSASLLFHQQVRTVKPEWEYSRFEKTTNFRFAVLLAGRGPLVLPQPELILKPTDILWSSIAGTSDDGEKPDQLLQIPTIHVHGMYDSGLELHRRLRERCCEIKSTTLVEWDGDHRVPIKTRDVLAVVHQIFNLARKTGVLG